MSLPLPSMGDLVHEQNISTGPDQSNTLLFTDDQLIGESWIWKCKNFDFGQKSHQILTHMSWSILDLFSCTHCTYRINIQLHSKDFLAHANRVLTYPVVHCFPCYMSHATHESKRIKRSYQTNRSEANEKRVWYHKGKSKSAFIFGLRRLWRLIIA